MAWIEKRDGKRGVSYRISVSCGVDNNGKQLYRRMTWKPKSNMTPRQIEKALARAAADFEREIEQGFVPDHKQTLAEYAEYVIDLKERTGVRPRTIDRYRDLMVRINQAIGHIKLPDLRPQHLNTFYKNLGESGIRADGERGVSRIDLAAYLKENHLSQTEVARKAGMSYTTVSAAVHGKAVSRKKAAAIADAVGKDFQEVFVVQRNTAPLSNKTILEYHRLISSIMAQAEKEMLIPYNPAAKATPPRAQKGEPDYYQPDVIADILDALDNAPIKWKAITYLLIDTGCRRGEAAGLKWKCVDLDNHIITIETALLYSPKRGVYEGPPKNGRSRTIRLAPETVELLRELKATQSVQRLVLDDRWVDSGYVFTQENGDRINPDTITDWLNKFSSANGLPHIHPHAFRHTAASTMIANGVDLVTAANELGHSNATTTATIYAHQIAAAKAKAGEVRSSIFKRKRDESK